MKEYIDLVKEVLTEGNYKPNRTGTDTISKFGVSYTIDEEDYPLLTTKQMDGYRWDSMIHELLWYLSGEEHIKNLREETSIWDAWADEEGRLDTAYGRFWRKYPVPDIDSRKGGETWAGIAHNQTSVGLSEGARFDQIQYIIDELQENPNSRRLVVNAWHPANAAESTLPPCHYSFVFNVQNGNELNLHLTQRSGDIALGIPFNIACYSLLQRMIAQEVGMEVGKFHHTIVDAHIYCGEGKRGEWYRDNMDLLQEVQWGNRDLLRGTIKDKAPADPENLDHVPGLLKQITREPLPLPEVRIADKSIDDIEYDDIELKHYRSHDALKFGVSE